MAFYFQHNPGSHLEFVSPLLAQARVPQAEEHVLSCHLLQTLGSLERR